MQDTADKTAANLFERMRSFSRRTRKLALAHPDDVLSEKYEYPAGEEEKALAEGRKPRPSRVLLETRPGAEILDFEIHALPDLIKEQAERLLDVAVAPEVHIDEPSDKPGYPPKRVFAGYNEEDPGYLAKLREAKGQQAAFVALHGTVGLLESVEGADAMAKVSALRGALDSRMIGWLATSIWGLTYAGGDLADFFTSGSSPASPG